MPEAPTIPAIPDTVEDLLARLWTAEHSRLDSVTKLAGDDLALVESLENRWVQASGAWSVKIYPTCGEAVAWAERGHDRLELDRERRKPNDPLEPRQQTLDLERDTLEDRERRRAASRKAAAARARSTVRRFMVHNRLDRMVTLTYRCQRCNNPSGCSCGTLGPLRPRGAEGRRLVMAHAAALVKALTSAEVLTGPYLYVPEPHQDGTWHLHLFVGHYVDKDRLATIWAKGWVDARRWKSNSKRSNLENYRLAAAYASKYAAKGWDAIEHGRTKGDHRYERSQGHAPRFIRRQRLELLDAVAFVDMVLEDTTIAVWCSDAAEEWEGPPVYIMTTGPPRASSARPASRSQPRTS